MFGSMAAGQNRGTNGWTALAPSCWRSTFLPSLPQTPSWQQQLICSIAGWPFRAARSGVRVPAGTPWISTRTDAQPCPETAAIPPGPLRLGNSSWQTEPIRQRAEQGPATRPSSILCKQGYGRGAMGGQGLSPSAQDWLYHVQLHLLLCPCGTGKAPTNWSEFSRCHQEGWWLEHLLWEKKASRLGLGQPRDGFRGTLHQLLAPTEVICRQSQALHSSTWQEGETTGISWK